MKPTRRLSRRSFLTRVTGGALMAGSSLAGIGKAGAAQVSDNDSGPGADPAGRGRGSGFSDSDTGPGADPSGRGRGSGGRGSSGVSDNDTGPNGDPPGRGRGSGTGYSDSDSGPYADPSGRGRGRGTGISDNDTGTYADPAGRGRGGGGGGGGNYSDNDTGAYADPAGRGRGGGGGGGGTSDSDPTDPGGQGRGSGGGNQGGGGGGGGFGVWTLREIRLHHTLTGGLGSITSQRYDANGGQVDIQVSGDIHDFCPGGDVTIRFEWSFAAGAGQLVAGGGVSASMQTGEVARSRNCRNDIAVRSGMSLIRPDTGPSRGLSGAEYPWVDGDRVMPGNGFRAMAAEGTPAGVGTLSVNTHPFDPRQPWTYYAISLGTPAGQVWYLYIFERRG